MGLPVARLHRSDYGGIGVSGLRPGEIRDLSKREVEQLKDQAGKKAEASAASKIAPLPARRHGHGPPSPARGRGRKRR